MIITHNLRKYFFRYPYLETLFIIMAYLALGYYINPNDILMLHVDFSSLTIILAIITLFHGISSGLLAMLILAVAMQYGYEESHFFYFLREFVLVLIFGEFHYYWSRIIDQHATEDRFTRQKLSELSKAFYMLKISHDQIEKSYVVKPMSLRNSIINIKANSHQENSESLFGEFLQLLQKSLNIESSFLLHIETNKKNTDMSVLAKFVDAEDIDTQDLLIQDAYKKSVPLYVSSDDSYSGSRYLAAIPALSYGEVVGMLVVAKMPFMSFNKDNLISATILVNYMFDEVYKMRIMQKMGGFLPQFQSNFRFESYRLHTLNRDFGTETTILLFKSYDKLATHLLREAVDKNLRTLDLMSYTQEDEFDIVAVLFPFADRTSVDGFVNRVYNSADIQKSSDRIKHTSLSIKDIALIEQYMQSTKEPHHEVQESSERIRQEMKKGEDRREKVAIGLQTIIGGVDIK